VPEGNPTGVVYGIILVGALMAAESGHHESYLDMIASAVVATVAYWLLHAYSSVLGTRLATGGSLNVRALWMSLVSEWAIVKGAAIPMIALLLAWATGAAQETAVTAALWSAVAGIVAFELAAGIRSHASAGELALQVGVGATMGIAILALRSLLL